MATAAMRHTRPYLEKMKLNLQVLEQGVPLDTMSNFIAASGVAMKDVYDIVIPARTLKHRRQRDESLTVDESDKLARLVRIFDLTVKVFGDSHRALDWLQRPKERFEERTPLHMLRTEFGARLVEEMLIQIDEGMFA
jgi:putative toxin-antitoxin system antitoxin component (TIGR02293 family)